MRLLAGVLKRAMPPKPAPAVEADGQDVPQGDDSPEPEAASGTGRGSAPRKAARTTDARAARKIKGRIIYLPDDLFVRILVQAHRRNRTIREYVAGILDRQVPDHRIVRAGDGEPDAA
jgi:hypothetical protein